MPFLRPLLRSYSMLFFSQHLGLAGLLLLATFAQPWAGAAGLGAAALAVAGARLGGFRRDWTDLGAYSFNSLLVGLALPLYFAPGWALVGLVGLGAGLALLLSVALGGWLAGRGLPFLSLPFVLTIWLLLLGSHRLPQLLPAEASGAYWLNQAYALGGPPLANAARWVTEADWPALPAAYLRALAAVLLQDSPWAGLLVAAGLLWHSRITFILSLIAFLGTWGLGALTGGATDTYDLGANYVMGAVAVGAVFAVPSAGSYALALASLPLTAVVLAAADALLGAGGTSGGAGLPALSLPYCGTALLLLYVLLLRERPGQWLVLTPVQRYSPEANYYAQLAAPGQRPPLADYLPLGLPFLGEWRCTQGYADGGPTHQGPWGQALDFVVADAEGRTYQGNGLRLSDYYCFDKPVLAPADGVVEAVVQHLPDNAVGEVDTRHNWGNTVVLRHRPGLYSQLSHLRAHSVRVQPGQAVRRGQVLAACGSSGRSPEPHLHFQLQTAPAVGSPTLPYPFEAYLAQAAPASAPPLQPKPVVAATQVEAAPAAAPGELTLLGRPKDAEPLGWLAAGPGRPWRGAARPEVAGAASRSPAVTALPSELEPALGGVAAHQANATNAAPVALAAPATPAGAAMAFALETYTVPRAGQQVQPVRVLPGLARALRLPPGTRLAVQLAENPAAPLVWEVLTDAYNQRYLHCAASGAVAYFELEEALLRFTAYYGPRRGWLRELYLAAYQVPLCYLPAPRPVALPLPLLRLPGLGWLQDVAAPFGQFVRPVFSLQWPGPDPGPAARQLTLRSEVRLRYFGRERRLQAAELTVADGALATLTVHRAGQPPLRLAFSEVSA
ncbi:peptidoglycan DD-metalloendopeptidase family protein [Hymenobacter sp. RP-2-7]|uniref:Peptidoglycan DD-metalloendopeptidase family protein n=1 Tax=Hymenobacter polaris TaxID=2682546 RepID=A0A7Y0AGI0_9BACT|nr:urea transporter [Hymenobacter polaris]NML66933.1 peptidoglycan DD-metalloendopeptidase family protein [Hymenobacter polaris]